MGISELERRVEEYNRLVTSQLRLIRNLEKRNKDLTSARIVFDSLRFSSFLATHDWHRARCQGQQPGTTVRATPSGRNTKLGLVVPTYADHASREVGRNTSMKVEENLSGASHDKNKEPADSSSTVANTRPVPANKSPRRYLEFRPLTEEEKKEFANSLTGEGRLKLIDTAEARRSVGSAARVVAASSTALVRQRISYIW